jgi:integrase/recombinase XerD
VSLTLYRRHASDCRIHQIRLSPREKRYFRDCDCPVWIAGTTDEERYPRQSLGTRDWAVAEAKLRAIQDRAADAAVHGPTIADCVRHHLDTHAENIAERTLAQHRNTLERFEAYARTRNKTFMREVDVDTCEHFKTYALRDIAPTTKMMFVSRLRLFLREAFRRGWLTDPLHERVRGFRATYEPALPFEPGEVQMILLDAERMNHGNGGYASNGHTFQLLLKLMLETGMRVSDAIRYDPARCTHSEHLWVYRFQPMKQRRGRPRKTMEVFLTDELKTAIDRAEWLSVEYPFAYRAFGAGAKHNTMENQVYQRMQAIGERSGVVNCRPHRLRDTFAVNMLLRGMALEDVSRLLGHSSIRMTEQHYSPWIPARQRRLEGFVAQALVNPIGNAGGN